MLKENQRQTLDLVAIAGEIVCAYVSNNAVRPADLTALIGSIHAALHDLYGGTTVKNAATQAETVEQPTVAQVRKSITHDGIVSFIDGKPYKTLKRHLTGHGLDPHSYRQRYGLPADYPMVAKSYSEARSQLAKDIGLGVPGRRNP